MVGTRIFDMPFIGKILHRKAGTNHMFKPPHRRRALSVSLVVLGGILIFLAPDNVWIGAVLAIAGIIIELIAFKLAHSNNGKK